METLWLMIGYVYTHVLAANVHHKIGIEHLSRGNAHALAHEDTRSEERRVFMCKSCT